MCIMNASQNNDGTKRETIIIYFSGEDIVLRERIFDEAKVRRQPVSQFMKAAAEYFMANTKPINED